MNIYLKVEIENRELISKIILGLNAASKGHEVLIGDDELLKLVQKRKLNPGIILEKSITPTSSRIKELREYKKHGSVITTLDEEGGLLLDNMNTFINSRYSKKTISMTDKIFCWSEYDYKSLLKIFPKYKKKFVITGNPRVNLWSNHYNNLFIKKNIKKKKYIFISSNFSIGVSTKRLSEIFKLNLENNYFNSQIYQEDFFHLQNYNLQLLFKFISAINYLTDRFPKLNFMVRPHPSENIKNWENFFKKKNNLEFSKEYSHSDWIENSEIILHHGCTGAIEAFARNKKIISFEPLKYKSKWDFSNKIGYTAKNQKELGDIIEKIYKIQNKTRINKKILSEVNYRFNDFKKNIFAQNINNEWSKFENIELSKKNNLMILKFINKLRLIKNKFIKPYFNEKFPPLDKTKIINLIKKIKETDNSLNNVNLEFIGPKLFKLSLTK